jgi:hypothetical protein
MQSGRGLAKTLLQRSSWNSTPIFHEIAKVFSDVYTLFLGPIQGKFDRQA